MLKFLSYLVLLILSFFHVFCMVCLHGKSSCLWNLSTELMFFDVCSVLVIFSVVLLYITELPELMDKSDRGLFCKFCAPTLTLLNCPWWLINYRS